MITRKNASTHTEHAKITPYLVRHLIAAVLFITTFIPRQLDLVSVSTVWHQRAWLFIEALQTGNLAETYQTPHPGVLTMWLSGIARWIATQRDPNFDSANLVDQMTVEMIPIVLLIAGLMVWAYYLLGRLLDYRIAAVAMFLMALDPLHLATTKTLHADGPMSALAMVSGLLMLVYVREQKRVHLVLSGVTAGLAIVTKTPAIFLVPYMILCLGVMVLLPQSNPVGSRRALTLRGREGVQRAFINALMWLGAMVVAYAIVWPAMWVEPITTVYKSVEGTFFYRETPHENPLYFMGEVTDDDPGLLYYALTVPLLSTAITTAGFVLGVLFLLIGRRAKRLEKITLALILAFFIFFTLQMTLGEKKFTRYDLPGVQFYIIMAGFGWVALGRMLTEKRHFLSTICALIIGCQALIVLPHHPYYGTHFNRLFGTPEQILANGIVPGQEEGEGLKEAGDWLNALPRSQELVVGAQNFEGFYRYFNGKSVPMSDDVPDYLVVTRNWTIRGMRGYSWAETWARYENREPKFTVSFDGVPYVWVYKTGRLVTDDVITNRIDATVGDTIKLLGSNHIVEENGVKLTLFWEGVAKDAADLTVFIHILDAEGNLVAQQDRLPQNGLYPTYLWDAGERVEDAYVVPFELPAGTYTVRAGMYELATGERRPITRSDGREAAERTIDITQFTLE